MYSRRMFYVKYNRETERYLLCHTHHLQQDSRSYLVKTKEVGIPPWNVVRLKHNNCTQAS